MADETREEWKKYLTPERKAEFERLGEEVVRHYVSHKYYANHPEKYEAALYWLGEKRKGRDWREWITLGLVFVGVVLTAITLIVTLT